MTESMLERFGAASRRRAGERMAAHPLAGYEEILDSLPPARPFSARLARGAGPLPRVIAELKRRSPSAGELQEPYHPRRIALGYARVGAAALSVLTEPESFGGDPAHMLEVRGAHLPILRKDFLVTPWQIAESRVHAADAVLLIAGLLKGPALELMMAAASRYGVEALVEVHNEEDMARACGAGARLIGVNSRDLATMTVDLKTAERLAHRVPPDCVAVAESGIRTRADIDRLMACGYESFLVGESLLRSGDPGDALWRLMAGTS